MVFGEEEDPFQNDTFAVKRLDRAKTLPSLEDGLVGDADFKDAVSNMKVARLTEEDGTVRVSD